ncbi:MAG: ABC transporter permease, partial [Pricia sp.]
MFKNYLKIAWRNLKKQPFFTFLNTFGLAIGMAGGLLISLYLYDELNYDNMFADADRIHRINVDIKFGGEMSELAQASAPMAAVMRNDFQQVELITRFNNRSSMLVKKSESNLTIKELNTTFVDGTFFEMFGLELLSGDKNTALKEPNTLILTKTAAERHFGAQEALGKTLVLNNSDTYTVTGILEDLPKNSFMRDHTVFMAMAGDERALGNEWGNHNYTTFIKTMPSANIADLQAPLQSLFETYMIPWVQGFMPGTTLENFEASGNYINYSTIALPD